ncbi:MAG: hypothetical protein ACYC8W_07770 [Candidatus Tyrphobacter sp.]
MNDNLKACWTAEELRKLGYEIDEETGEAYDPNDATFYDEVAK